MSTDPDADECLVRAWAASRWPHGIPRKRETLTLWAMSEAAAIRLAGQTPTGLLGPSGS